MAGLPVAVLATTAFALMTGSDVHRYLPLGVLLWEAKHADAVRSKAVAGEVLARYTAKKLEEDQIARAVGRALDVQGNERLPWASEWGDLIEAATSDGKVSKSDQQRFRSQSVVLRFNSRPRVRAGDPLPICITLKEARIGSATALTSQVYFQSAKLEAKPLKQSRNRPPGASGFMIASPQLGWLQLYGSANASWPGGRSFGEAELLLDVPKSTEPGVHQCTVVVAVTTRGQSVWATSGYLGTPKKDDPDRREFEATIPVTVDAGENTPIEVVTPSAEIAKAMAETLRPTAVQVDVYDGRASATVQFSVEGRPMEGAFDVFWRSGEEEQRLGPMATGTSVDPFYSSYSYPGRENIRYVSGAVHGYDVPTVDVILRPSQSAALRTIDLTRIYGDEIVFNDVTVTVNDRFGTRVVASTPKKSKRKGPNLWESLQNLVGR